MESRKDIGLVELFGRITAQQNLRGTIFCEMTEAEKQAYANQAALALFVEVGELTSSWSFASWKTTPTDQDNIKREAIDILFFLNIICKCHNITVQDLIEKFEWVIENNARRMNNGEHKEVQL